VIVVLKSPPVSAAAGAGAAVRPRPELKTPFNLERHFRTSELSQDSALAASNVTAANAAAPPVRYYPNLGVALGTVAPGVAVTSARPGGGWQEMDGTSMATPHIAGLAALLMQARPNATITRVERAIFDSCTGSPSMPPDRANRGLPDGVKALQLLVP
jgi:subtilisin family serine protease